MGTSMGFLNYFLEAAVWFERDQEEETGRGAEGCVEKRGEVHAGGSVGMEDRGSRHRPQVLRRIAWGSGQDASPAHEGTAVEGGNGAAAQGEGTRPESGGALPEETERP
ncbi:unnamed protein product [Lampetra planeri]